MLDLEVAYQLLRSEKVPEHIVRHSEKVALISVCLGSFLKEKFPGLDLMTLAIASLLHDIKKMASFKTGENHALAGYKMIEKLGYPRIGEVVYAHIFLKLPRPGDPVREEEIVFYADKRVRHDEIVNLEERFADLRERYGKTLKALIRIRLSEEMTLILERRLFKNLPFKPHVVNNLNEVREVKHELSRCLKGGLDCWWEFLRERGFPPRG